VRMRPVQSCLLVVAGVSGGIVLGLRVGALFSSGRQGNGAVLAG